MKATIDFDDQLYRQLKIEAARRGRTIRELIAEGVRRVLDSPLGDENQERDAKAGTWNPSWLGSLSRYGQSVGDHDMSAVRESVVNARARDK